MKGPSSLTAHCAEFAWGRYSNICFQTAYHCGLFRQIQIYHSSHIGEQGLWCNHRDYLQQNPVLRILCRKKDISTDKTTTTTTKEEIILNGVILQ